MVMSLHEKEKHGSWQVKREQLVIYILCIFVVTGLVVSMIQRPDADPDILEALETVILVQDSPDDDLDIREALDTVMLVQQSAPIKPIEERDPQCRTSLDGWCTSNKKFNIQMAAIPHTASTSTNELISSGKRSWNMSVAIEDKGFFCAAPSQRIQIQAPPSLCRTQLGNASTVLFGCVLGNFHYTSRTHGPYNKIYKRSQLIFTTLRDPAQLVLSHYRSRYSWDQQWTVEYLQKNLSNLSNVEPIEYATNAWWRHNLFTKMLATNTKLLWLRPEVQLTPTKEESDRENALGEDSVWLHIALDRLKAMPFFGLMHRLPESFELMGFHLCFPANPRARTPSKPRPVNAALESAARRYFALDTILMREAEQLFDVLVLEMRKKKAQGFLCDLSEVLKEADAEFGLKCV
jgi:hypothetical protein